MSVIDFNSDKWDLVMHEGPVIHASDDVKAVVVTGYRMGDVSKEDGIEGVISYPVRNA